MCASSVSDQADTKDFHVRIRKAADEDPAGRIVIVRYFLDRPGFDGLHNSASRIWYNPPSSCTADDIQLFLESQGIAMPGLLLEVFLDRFESFMMLQVCKNSGIEWDFQQTNKEPGVLNIRLTDTSTVHQDPFPKRQPPPIANTIPVGLFSFSMMIGLETIALLGELVPGSVSESFALIHGPYMLFVGGMLQIIVGISQIPRNNLYGTVAFLGFGSFWLSNGLYTILNNYSHSDILSADLLDVSDPTGRFLRLLFLLFFSLTLLGQTFMMHRLSTTLISLLCVKILVQALAGWSRSCAWLQLVAGSLTSAMAGYVFVVEFTNQVYHKQIFETWPWSVDHSPTEVFGVRGQSNTLHNKATRLRMLVVHESRVRQASKEQ